MQEKIPKALTIAGSDSGGGAGIQADLKTFTALKVFGASVITVITAQNTKEITAMHNVPIEIISKQIDAVLSDIGADAVKIGMLSNAEIIRTVSECLKKFSIQKIVMDPVMISTSGAKLLDDNAVDTLKKDLIPMALVVTPNIPEAEVLSGIKINSLSDVDTAAKKILEFGCKSVLMKGGHLNLGVNAITDVFYYGTKSFRFTNRKISKEGHGTGCTLSSAIAAFLARGFSLEESVKNAIAYVHNSLENGFKVGSQNYVLCHYC